MGTVALDRGTQFLVAGWELNSLILGNFVLTQAIPLASGSREISSHTICSFIDEQLYV